MVATAVTALIRRRRHIRLTVLFVASIVVVAFPVSATVGASTPDATTTTSGVSPTSESTTTSPTTPTTTTMITSPTTATIPTVSTAPKWNWVDRGPTLVDVSCATADKCVAVGGTGWALRSIDGGTTRSWSQVPWLPAQTTANETLASVTCSNSTCLAISSSGVTIGVSHVYRSTDDGLKWTDTGPLPKAVGGTQVASRLGCDTAKIV